MFSTVGDIMSTVGDILSTMGDTQYRGDIMMHMGDILYLIVFELCEKKPFGGKFPPAPHQNMVDLFQKFSILAVKGFADQAG